MYGREFFHESVVKDIVDVITSLKDYDEVQFLNNQSNHRSFKSITSATKDLILTFPVLVSTDIDPDTAIMIAKAHEKKCASLLHILFSAICVEANEDVYDYVKKFHSNLGSLGSTLDDYMDAVDDMVNTYGESASPTTLTIDHKVLDAVLVADVLRFEPFIVILTALELGIRAVPLTFMVSITLACAPLGACALCECSYAAFPLSPL